MPKRLRYFWRPTLGFSWRVDETYIKVKGHWKYLYRAVDKYGHTIDFYLSATRNINAAKRFLAKALRKLKDWEIPTTINTDKAAPYQVAIKELKEEGILPNDVNHRQVKYLNNIIEADHGKLKGSGRLMSRRNYSPFPKIKKAQHKIIIFEKNTL